MFHDISRSRKKMNHYQKSFITSYLIDDASIEYNGISIMAVQEE